MAALAGPPAPKGTKDSLSVCCVTWNVGNEEPFGGSHADEIETLIPKSIEWDVIVFGTQECHYKLGEIGPDSSDEDEDVKEEDVKVEVKGEKKEKTKLEKAPKGHFEELVENHLGGEYHTIARSALVEMKLIVLCKKKYKDQLKDVDSAHEGTGLGHVYGNKGGLAVWFTLLGSSFCFVSTHLAAHDHMLRRRNEDIAEIIGGMKVGKRPLDVVWEFDHCFWMGDMNYRSALWTDFDPNAEEAPKMAKLSKKDPEHQKRWDQVKALIDKKDFDAIFEGDQLRKELLADRCLCGFQEGKPTFSPTFKVKRARQLEEGETHPHWIFQRIPAYCDRILWKSVPSKAGAITQTSLVSVPEVTTSDHKPVRSTFEIAVDNTEFSFEDDPTKCPQLFFKDLQAKGVVAADVTGTSDPYIQFHSSPPQIFGTKGKPPITEVQARTLNPVWGELRIDLKLAKSEDISRATVKLAVFDHDALNADDPLGTCAISLGAALASQDHSLKINEPIVLGGRKKGMLTGTLYVVAPPGSSLAAKNAPGVEYGDATVVKNGVCAGCVLS